MELIIFLAFVLLVAWISGQVIARRPNKTQSNSRDSFISYPEEAHADLVFTGSEDEEEEPADFQPLLTKTVDHKKLEEWNEALECLDQAYQLAARFPAEYCEGAYLRLPNYLQLAGKSDEAWRWLNNLSNGVVPHRGNQPCGLENNIYWRLKVEDKMRLFLEKEKRFKEALRWRCTNLYLSAVTQFRLAMELPDGANRAIPYGIPALTETLSKPVEKAKLAPELAEKLASTLFFRASSVNSDAQALTEFITVIDEISDLIEAYSNGQPDTNKQTGRQSLHAEPVKNEHTNKPNESILLNRDRKIVKTISGRMLLEEGFGTGENQGMTSPVPRWFVDFRSEGRLRVNCMTQATLYLRDDGHLFSVNKQWWGTTPLENANIEDIEGFWKNVYKSEKASVNYDEIWETCEYVPDQDCPNINNIWHVAAGCRRSGRFFYTARKKTAKKFLEGPDENIRWIYSEMFDQFTDAYEERYQQRIRETIQRNEEAEEYSKKNTSTFEFEFDFTDFIAKDSVVDHYVVLGVDKNAGPREVKQAYWTLAKQYHPDLNPNDSLAEERFRCVSVSYQEIMKKFGN